MDGHLQVTLVTGGKDYLGIQLLGKDVEELAYHTLAVVGALVGTEGKVYDNGLFHIVRIHGKVLNGLGYLYVGK